MSRAPERPIFAADAAPVSFLVDYDGTISSVDVGDALMDRFVADRATVAAKDADYDAGRVGSRELMQWDMEVLPRDAELLRSAAAALPHDPASRPSWPRSRPAARPSRSSATGWASTSSRTCGGWRRRWPTCPSRPTRTASPARTGMTFPFGHPACFVCGTCKRERVRAHQAGGRVVVFIGDGTSDRYAAHHADVVFAKGPLARWCAEVGHPFTAWGAFAEITDWLVGAFSSGALPSDGGGSRGVARRPWPTATRVRLRAGGLGPGRSVPVPVDERR